MGDFGRIARGAVMAVVAMGCAGAALAQDAIRLIDGSLTYRERTALPPDAVAIVEARDARDRLLGEATLATRGAQVPVPFQLGLPAGLDATLRAALIVDGRPLWYVADLPVPAGTDPVSLGEIVLGRFIPMGFASTLRCGETELSVGFYEQDAVIEVEGRRTVLPRIAGDAGDRFAAGGTSVTIRDGVTAVSLNGADLGPCAAVPPRAPAPYRAQGNEPGWTLAIAGGQVRLTLDYGATTVETALPEARFAGGAFVYETPEGTIRLTPGLCRDDMTRMPYPETAEVIRPDRRLSGCGGDPADLLRGDWVVETIAGQGIAAGSRVTLDFDGTELGGEASCNRYATTFAIGGEGVSVGQIAATKRACEERLMDQEGRIFRALASVGRFDIDASGALLLYDPASPDPVLTARR